MNSSRQTANQPLYDQASHTIEVMREVLTEHLGVDGQQLEFNRPLDSLGLDSLSFLEFMFDVEKILKITLPDLPPDLKTIGELVLFVDAESKKQAKGRDA